MIVPGSPNALLMARAADPLDELGKIDRSIRFRSSASAYLSKTFASAGNRKTMTFSAWVKRAVISNAKQDLFISGSNVGGQQSSQVSFEANDTLSVYTTISGSAADITLNTSQVFRDTGSHDHIVVAIDTTQATASSRAKLYVNGIQVTNFLTATYPAQNLDTAFGNAVLHTIGRFTNVSANPFDGYLSHIAYVDGQALTPTVFGQFHPLTGQWRPKRKAEIKAVVDAGGANSFFLPFDDPTNTTTLGADASSKGSNWTANNVSLTAGTAYDSAFDTPTSNYCTLNPLLPINIASFGYYGILPADGALKMTGSASPAGNYQNGTQLIKFKTYYEMLVGAVGAGTFTIGIQNPVTGAIYTYQQDGSKNLNGTTSAYGAAFTASDRVAVSVDPVAQTLEFFKQTGGTGSFVSQGVISSAFPSGTYVPFFYASNGTTLTVNFGQQGFSNASLPSGVLTLNTKNLARPAIPQASKAFAAVTDTGANILSTLSAAESWGSYIRIVKRREASEGWRWMFFDDPSNYLDSSSTGVKAAIPSFTGTSYAGYSLKVSASNGVATGRLTHANGVADTVTDSLGNARKAVILKNEATGSWYLYHPDLTAGKLLYLEQTAGETTDSTISSVTSNSFVVAAALPSGTYRWVALAELDGFLKLSKYTGNASSDGPFVNLGLTPALDIVKGISTTARSWQTIDTARDKVNPATTALHMESAVAENAGYLQDMVSSGYKYRTAPETAHNASENYIMVSIAAFPFRYANAR